MRAYEVMVIFDADLEEDAIRSAIDRFTQLVRSRGGTPGQVDLWGKRRFAYELKHRWEGYYVLLDVTAEPAVIAELDRSLHLADEVIRHKVIHLPDKVVGARRSKAGAAVGGEAVPDANGA